MRKVLIIGTSNDPHVSRVQEKLTEIEVPSIVLDYLTQTPFSVSSDESASCTIEIDGQHMVDSFLIWDRLKMFAVPMLSLNGDKRSAAYQSKEWIAFYHMLTGLFSANVVNSPQSRTCLLKPFQQSVAASVGLKVPPTLVTNIRQRAVEFAAREERVIVKSLSAGKVMPRANEADIPYNLMTMPVSESKLRAAADDEIRACPHFFQRKIEKAYELRVVAVGDRLFPFKVDSQKNELTKLDWRNGIPIVDFAPIELEASLENKLKAFLAEMGLFTGSFDLMVDEEGESWFLECNQDGQWIWLDDLIDEKIAESFAYAFKERLTLLTCPPNMDFSVRIAS